MCHRISWYHALCLHQDHASTFNICCKDSLQCNYDCGNLESWSLPMLGACPSCVFMATFAENLPRKSQSFSIPPIIESFEGEPLVDNDETYFSGTHSEDSIDEIELFDRITF
ncbi:hypothetical protein BDW62DRAFT_198214 [Aspergillus aurantiobrunneus]